MKIPREIRGKHCARSTNGQIQDEYPYDDIEKCSVQAALLALGSCLNDPSGDGSTPCTGHRFSRGTSLVTMAKRLIRCCQLALQPLA